MHWGTHTLKSPGANALGVELSRGKQEGRAVIVTGRQKVPAGPLDRKQKVMERLWATERDKVTIGFLTEEEWFQRQPAMQEEGSLTSLEF